MRDARNEVENMPTRFELGEATDSRVLTRISENSLVKCNNIGTLLPMATRRTPKTLQESPSLEAGFFWDNLAQEMEDPEFRREFFLERLRISTIDDLIGNLDEAREGLELSKADIARAVGAQGSVVRRIFSSDDASPTLATITELAAAVGMRVVTVPMSPEERRGAFAALGYLPPKALAPMRAAALAKEDLTGRVARPPTTIVGRPIRPAAKAAATAKRAATVKKTNVNSAGER
jgi:transcriptional regulator with XRE-family HTH domain